jgi:peptide deformylase
MRVDDAGDFTDAGEPFCTVCSRLAMSSGLAKFALWVNNQPKIYDVKDYNINTYNMYTKNRRILELVFDDPILHERAKRLSLDEIRSQKIRDLISNMRYTCNHKKYGVGLSANQVGELLAISLIAIKPTPSRPSLKTFDKVIINAEILETFGEPEPKWEGCLSTARDENGEPAMAQVPRFNKVRLKYLDENGNEHEEVAEDFVAHVIQHEVDHINGKLFTDIVDPNTLISNEKYREMVGA